MTFSLIRNAGRLLRAFAISLLLGKVAAQIPAFPGAQGFGAYATGGRGGDVVMWVDPHLDTLLQFKYQGHFFAKDGEPGSSKNCHGAAGDDKLVAVPPGTRCQHCSRV